MPDSLRPGVVLAGRYRVESLLGAGGMGEVYRARDEQLGRLVAIKILPPELTRDGERLQRFSREARAASALNHPNIVTIHEVGESVVDGRTIHFIVTELVEGETLRERIWRGKQNLKRDLELIAQVADGLAKAHASGIVHRDIKPDNIMVSADGHAKILDFGVAKLLDTGDDPMAQTRPTPVGAPTKEGVAVGTPAYFSPEQAHGKPVDQRSDIFSLGVVLYELLTGRQPFAGSSSLDTLNNIVRTEPPPLRETKPDLPHETERMVRRCLAKEPDERYQSAKDLAIDLRQLARELDSSPRGGVATAARKRGKAFTALASLAIVIAVGTAVWFARHRSGPTPASLVAEQIRIRQLTDNGQVTRAVISPDGRYVAYLATRGGERGVWLQQVGSGTELRLIRAAKDVEYGYLAFSGGSDYLYFTARTGRVPQYALYQLPLVGGTERKVSSELSAIASFALSPDEKKVAFYRGLHGWGAEELVVANVDGSTPKVVVRHKLPRFLTMAAPAWSPDGSKIVFGEGEFEPELRFTPTELNLASRVERAITSPRWLPYRGGYVLWSHDGRSILLCAAENGFWGSNQLWLISYPDGAAHKLTNDVDGYSGLSASQDWKSIVSVRSHSDSNLWVVPVEKPEEAKQITSAIGRNYSSHGIDWAPTGRIFYHLVDGKEADIWSIDPDGSNPVQHTRSSGINLYPVVSPDGKRVAFTSARAGPYHLWTMNIDGTDLRHYPQAIGPSNSYSPDGQTIVYESNTGHVFRIALGGGAPVRLTSERCDGPKVSPDGKWIVCQWQPAAETKRPATALVPFAGGPPQQFFDVPVAPGWENYSWLPDSSGFAFLDARDGVSNIWLQPLNGNPPRQLTKFTSGSLRSFDFSPDGKQIVVSRTFSSSDAVLITTANR